MSFANVDERAVSANNSKFRRTEYMSLTEGQHTIRILNENALKKYAHYISRVYVECPGEDCPICELNQKIRYENPEDFRSSTGWTPRRERFYVNVLDKTPVRFCENCGKEHTNISLTECGTCTSNLGDVVPLNKVVVLSSGRVLFEDLNVMVSANRDEKDEPVDPRAYDFLLVVRGAGRTRTVTPVPQFTGQTNPIDTEGMELFDLENCIITLEKEEMLDLHNGTSLKDIFALRKSQKEIKEGAEVVREVGENSEEIKKAVADSVDEILKS